MNIWGTVPDWLMVTFTLVTAIAAIFAYFTASKQLKIINYTELFIIQETIPVKIQNYDSKTKKMGTTEKMYWRFLIKNTSSFPVYLNSYTLNGIKTDIVRSVIPNDLDHWYGIPVTKDVEMKGEFYLLLDFENYIGEKYQTEGYGRLEETWWNISTRKSKKVK